MLNENATIYNGADVELTSGTNIPLPTILTNNGLTVGGDSITVADAGTYLISYRVNTATGAGTTDIVGLAVNDIVNDATSTSFSLTDSVSVSAVLNLVAGDELSLVATITGATTIEANGGPSAVLTVVRLV